MMPSRSRRRVPLGVEVFDEPDLISPSSPILPGTTIHLTDVKRAWMRVESPTGEMLGWFSRTYG